MEERPGAVTFQGAPLTLVGPELAVGSAVPDAVLLANDLSEARLSDHAGKVRAVATVPSLDTPVCDAEARRFNQVATGLGDDVVVLVVSMDLPFAQARWCGAAGVDRVVTLSDHREAALATACGLLVKELRLLARAVFVVDPSGKVGYVQLVKELAEPPDYDAAAAAIERVRP